SAGGRPPFVNRAEKPRGAFVDDERRATSVLDAHVTAVADEVRERLGLVTQAFVVVAVDAQVGRQRRKATNPAFDAAGNRVPGVLTRHGPLISNDRLLAHVPHARLRPCPARTPVFESVLGPGRYTAGT